MVVFSLEWASQYINFQKKLFFYIGSANCEMLLDCPFGSISEQLIFLKDWKLYYWALI